MIEEIKFDKLVVLNDFRLNTVVDKKELYEKIKDFKYSPEFCKNCGKLYVSLENFKNSLCGGCYDFAPCGICSFKIEDTDILSNKILYYYGDDKPTCCGDCGKITEACRICFHRFMKEDLVEINLRREGCRRYNCCKPCLEKNIKCKVATRDQFQEFSNILTDYSQEIPDKIYKNIYDDVQKIFNKNYGSQESDSELNSP